MYTIKLVKSTGCLLLLESNNTNDYLDYQFINLYQLESMTMEEIKECATEFALHNSISEYDLDLSEVA